MLSLQERHQVLLFVRHFCKAKLLPADICTKHWVLNQRFHTAGRARWISRIFYALFAAHALYTNLSLVYVLIFKLGIPLPQIIIHAMLAIAYEAYAYFYYVLYIRHAEVYARLFKMTLTGNIGQSKITYVLLINE